jgi:hypothetical protein
MCGAAMVTRRGECRDDYGNVIIVNVNVNFIVTVIDWEDD